MVSYKGADKDFSLEGQTAIITGGAAGIGYATAEFFAKKGVNLVLADLNPGVDAAAKKLGSKNIGVPGNVCDSAYRKSVIEAGVKAFGKIDILVNSAGIVALDKAESLSEDIWNKTIAVNLTAAWLHCQYRFPGWGDSA